MFTQFTEIHGMVLLGTQSVVEEGLRHWQHTFVPFSRWRYERFANHIHASRGNNDREQIREEITILAGFEEALQQGFPQYTFVLSHIPCYAVTFYQFVDDAPVMAETSRGPLEKAVWCQSCRGHREYQALMVPDAEFPWLKWGCCLVCDNDLLLKAEETCRVLKPL